MAEYNPSYLAELSRDYTELLHVSALGKLTEDVVVNIQADSRIEGTPASFWPSERAVFIGLNQAFPDRRYDRTKAADTNLLMGMLYHEAGHAIWSNYGALGGIVGEVITIFEEARIEKRVMDHLRYPSFLRASFSWLLVQFAEAAEQVDSEFGASRLWALTYGRYLGGVALKDEVAPIDTVLRGIVGDNAVDVLTEILSEALEADGTVEEIRTTLTALAYEWLEIFDLTGEESGTGEMTCACNEGESPEDTEGSGKSEDKDDEDEGGDDGESPAPECKPGEVGPNSRAIHEETLPEHLKDELRKALEEVREEVFNPSSSADKITLSDPRASFTSLAKSKVGSKKSEEFSETSPSTEVLNRTKRLSKILGNLSLPTVTKVRTNIDTPTGKLHSREAVRQAADRSMGRMSSARPWKSVKKHHTVSKPLSIGVMTDTSGSMTWAEEFVAEFAYIVSNAGLKINAKVCAVAFDEEVKRVVLPGERLRTVRQYAADGGSENFDGAAAALDGALRLTTANGEVKLLFIVSDGNLVRGDEMRKAKMWIDKMIKGGTQVFWIGLNGPSHEKFFSDAVSVPVNIYHPESAYPELEQAIISSMR